jgi:radical SAM superfamily enzyme YgiQ (UPF0313 family)
MPQKPQILFTSPAGPYEKHPIDDDPVDFFYYRNTFKQKMFRLKSWQSWHSLHFLAQNTPVASVVLENPTMKKFHEEVNNGTYSTIAIAFTAVHLKVVREMLGWIKHTHPAITIILGGYGTPYLEEDTDTAVEIRQRTDHICSGEGISFMRKFCAEKYGVKSSEPIKQNLLPARNCFIHSDIVLFKQSIIVARLGCRAGCPFCSTSGQFHKKIFTYLEGAELAGTVVNTADRYPSIQSALIYSEDFLADRDAVLQFKNILAPLLHKRKSPFFLTVFASVRSISQYAPEELTEIGIGTIFVGVESLDENAIRTERLHKRGTAVEPAVRQLHAQGIATICSLIVGWDIHNENDMERDLDAFIRLQPSLYQIIPMLAAPGTPLWHTLKKEGRLSPEAIEKQWGINRFNFPLKNASAGRVLKMIHDAYLRLAEEGGPWPIRLAQVYLNGMKWCSRQKKPLFRKRARQYRRMVIQLLPLAVTTPIFFHDRRLRLQVLSFLKECFRHLPLQTVTGTVIGMVLAPLLCSVYGFVLFRNALRSSGDLPPFIRKMYNS